MSFIASIGTAVPAYKHAQSNISSFFAELFEYDEVETQRLKTLYERSGITTRYSTASDYSAKIEDRSFFPETRNLEPFPTLEYRMDWYAKQAPILALSAIYNCISNKEELQQITHLITVSCTGLAAPGLDVDLVQRLGLQPNVERTSVNFMGCYAAIHGLKQANYICKSTPAAKVLVVCVELCTLHFQKKNDIDNTTATLLFGDGAAATLVCGSYYENDYPQKLAIKNFYGIINPEGKSDMAWQLSSTGFLMTLSSYIPKLIEAGIKALVHKALEKFNYTTKSITHWAIHPGGRRILEVITQELALDKEALHASYTVLKEYGNMSSPTVLFVLKNLWDGHINFNKPETILSAAFGPGITMETMVLEVAPTI